MSLSARNFHLWAQRFEVLFGAPVILASIREQISSCWHWLQRNSQKAVGIFSPIGLPLDVVVLGTEVVLDKDSHTTDVVERVDDELGV